MRKAQFSEGQMVKILRAADKTPVAQMAKQYWISERTVYVWRKRYGKRIRRLRAKGGISCLRCAASRLQGRFAVKTRIENRIAPAFRWLPMEGFPEPTLPYVCRTRIHRIS